jgi:hypothetical protein
LLSDRQLKKTTVSLKALERQVFRSRQRFVFYEYLEAVYEFYARLRRTNKAKISAGRIATLFGIRTQKRTHSIRVIIDATSVSDEKTKSRWSRALRYAWRKRNRWKSLKAFFRLNGGPAGSAVKFAALHPRTLPDWVRMDGEDRVSKIPLPVDVERIMPGEMFVRNGRVFRQPDVTDPRRLRLASDELAPDSRAIARGNE